MKISIITSTYNSINTLQDTFDSVCSQKDVLLEYIVIDGDSTDATIEVIEKSDLVDAFVSERDKGIYDALNKGLQMASGDVIGFLHSDDLFASKTTISEIVKIFENQEVDGVYGDLEYVDKNDTDKIIRHWKSEPFSKKLLKKGWMPAHPTLFLKREVYEKHGSFDLKYKIASDYDFMLRVLEDPSLKFAYLPLVITKMRVGGASNGKLKNVMQKSKEDLEIMHKHKIGGLLTLLGKNLSKIKQYFY